MKRSDIRLWNNSGVLSSLNNHIHYWAMIVVLVITQLALVSTIFFRLSSDINTVDRKLLGLYHLRQSHELVQRLQQHRSMSAGLLSGIMEFAEEREALALDLDQRFSEISSVISDDENIRLRLDQIKGKWSVVKGDSAFGLGLKTVIEHNRLVKEIFELQIYMADNYGLYKFDASDDHYMLEVLLERIPQAIESIGQARAMGILSFGGPGSNNSVKAQMRIVAYDVENRLDDLIEELERSSKHKPALLSINNKVSQKFVETAEATQLLLRDGVFDRRKSIGVAEFYHQANLDMYREYGVFLNEYFSEYEGVTREKIKITKYEAARDTIIALMFCFAAIYLCYILQRSRREREERLSSIIESSMDALIQINDRGIVIGWNGAAVEMFGWPVAQAVGRSLEELIIPVELRDAHREGIRSFLKSGHTRKIGSRVEVPAIHQSGRRIIIELSIANFSIRRKTEFSAYLRDITEQKNIQDSLRIAAVTFESHEPILVTDANANIVRVNHAFELTTGYSAAEIIGKNPRMMQSGRHDAGFYRAMWEELITHGRWSGEIWDRHKNGRIYPKMTTISAVKDGHNQVAYFVSIFTDITERKRIEAEIENLAYYDVLTQLPNRRLLMHRLAAAVSTSSRNQRYGAIMFMDMDNFKNLNDTMGHEYGDELLKQVAQRLSLSVRDGDMVARLGGDEFVMLFENLGQDLEHASANAATVAENIRKTISTPYQLDVHVQHSSPSLGVCMFRDKQDIQELLKRADLAMYHAKEAGKDQVRFYDPELQGKMERRATLDNDMRKGLPQGQFLLHYQVQVNEALEPVGVEALLRWSHPSRGMVSPEEFITQAEDTGFIVPLGTWVLECVGDLLTSWSDDKIKRHLSVSVNVSAKQFKQSNFVDTIESVILKGAFHPSNLKLELTESVALGQQDSVAEKMERLKSLGVTLSLDDFGTGYSSLSYLKRLPFDQIKIDKSFIRDLTKNSEDVAMVQTIVNLAQKFKIDVIAEGVETESQMMLLRDYSCKLFQGYLFGKPVSLPELEELLTHRPYFRVD